jgi:hypothetical protein
MKKGLLSMSVFNAEINDIINQNQDDQQLIIKAMDLNNNGHLSIKSNIGSFQVDSVPFYVALSKKSNLPKVNNNRDLWFENIKFDLTNGLVLFHYKYL